MAKDVEEIVWMDEIERRARELCEREHDCADPSTHDCQNWLTYTEAERVRARERIAREL